MDISKAGTGGGIVTRRNLPAQGDRKFSIDEAPQSPRKPSGAEAGSITESVLRKPDKPPRKEKPELPRLNPPAQAESFMPPPPLVGPELTSRQLEQLESLPSEVHQEPAATSEPAPKTPRQADARHLARRIWDAHVRGNEMEPQSLARLKADIKTYGVSPKDLSEVPIADVAKMFVALQCSPELHSDAMLGAVMSQLRQRIGQIDAQTFLLLTRADLPLDAKTRITALLRNELRTMRSATPPGGVPRLVSTTGTPDVPGLKDKLLLECMAGAIAGTLDKSPKAISEAVEFARQVFAELSTFDPQAVSPEQIDPDVRLQAHMVRLMPKLASNRYAQALMVFEGKEVRSLSGAVDDANAVWKDFMRPLSATAQTPQDRIAADVKFFGNAMAGASQAKNKAVRRQFSAADTNRWFGNESWDVNKSRIESVYWPRVPPAVQDCLEFLTLFDQVQRSGKLGKDESIRMASRLNELIEKHAIVGKVLGQQNLFDLNTLKSMSAKNRPLQLAAWIEPRCIGVRKIILDSVVAVAEKQAEKQMKSVDDLYPVN